MTDTDPRLEGLQRLLSIVDRLRAPDGCPWDSEQTLESMAPSVLEEAHEVVEALRRGDDPESVGEIGDLLMNVFLLGRIGEDEGRFSLADIAERISDKLVRRHPHVFGDMGAVDAAAALRNWEAIKQQERDADSNQRDKSVLSGIPTSLPGLHLAYRTGQKAAQVGFDWPDASGPLAKVSEELAELEQEIAAETPDPDRISAEIGDLLFAVVNVARKLGVDPEHAIRGTVERFATRFRHVENRLGERLGRASLEEMDRLWNEAK